LRWVLPFLAAAFVFCSDEQLAKANGLLESGDFLGARKIYSRMIDTRPQDFAAQYGVAMSFCAEAIYKTELGLAGPQDWYPAIYHMTVASHLDDNAQVRRTLGILHFNLGLCYKKDGDREAAIGRIQRAVSYDSTLLKAYNLLGALYHEQGDYTRAEQCYRRTIILKPDYAMAHFNLGALAWAQQDLAGAEKHFLDAVALEPESDYFQSWLDKARSALGRR
jgi:tetratricopeptide (TPR) repeat protein